MRQIKFSPPDITEEEISEVADALRSGWITTGPRTKELERRLASWIGVNRCVCLNSQTACAEMALRILGIGPGDEVIVPAYTYTASASVVCHVGAKIVFVDSQKDSVLLDYDKVVAAITERTKAIIPVDLGGLVCDYERLFQIVEEKKNLFRPSTKMQETLGRIAILADSAHALGAKVKMNGQWKMIGQVADFTSFSFHAVKNFTTAEGGALTWNLANGAFDEEIYKQLQLLSLHGQSKDALAKTQSGAWEYDIVGTWYKCNMTDVVAAIGLVQLKRYPNMLIRRKEIIHKYDAVLKPLGIDVLEHQTDCYESSAHLYITRVPNISEEVRNEIIKQLADKGVPTNVHYKPLPMHTAYKELGFDIADYPNAYDQYHNCITLPLHTSLSDGDVDFIIENYCDVVKNYL